MWIEGDNGNWFWESWTWRKSQIDNLYSQRGNYPERAPMSSNKKKIDRPSDPDVTNKRNSWWLAVWSIPNTTGENHEFNWNIFEQNAQIVVDKGAWMALLSAEDVNNERGNVTNDIAEYTEGRIESVWSVTMESVWWHFSKAITKAMLKWVDSKATFTDSQFLRKSPITSAIGIQHMRKMRRSRKWLTLSEKDISFSQSSYNSNEMDNTPNVWIEEVGLSEDIRNLFNNLEKIKYSSDDIEWLKNKINLTLKNVDITDSCNILEIISQLDVAFFLSNNGTMDTDTLKVYAVFYATLMDIDIKDDDDVNTFIKTVKWENTKYTERYQEFTKTMDVVEDNIITEIATNTLIERYKAAERLAEMKKVYWWEFISFFPSNKSEEWNSFRIAGNLVGENGKNLNLYKIKTDRTDGEEKSLQYTAFNVTFNNIFNVDDPIVQKLANQNINLRDELSKNGIYYQDTNQFNEEARNNYIQSEKFLSTWLTTEEISSLSESLKNLPEEVKSNYEILSGNFDADQGSFEEIAKIYALWEIINNIRNYFENNKENPQLKSIVEWLELDENEPAKIERDCLYLKWKINWTVTNIKYDLRTGKLFMNSFLQKVDGKERFVIWNNEPTTEIWNLNSFQDILDGYKSNSFIQLWEESSESTDSSQMEDDNSDTQNKNNEQTLKYLTENKLIQDLGYIKEVVIKKSKEQGTKNNFIDKFLKTFNMLPGSWNAKIDIDGWSSLYNFLESIKNTEDQRELEEFSFEMPELMECCWFNWWNNIENPKEVSFSLENLRDSEKNFVQSIQESINQFFNWWEKNNIENNKNGYFNGSFNLSFAGVLIKYFCKKEWAWWKLNTTEMWNFVKTLKDCSNGVLTAYDACENSEVSYWVKDSDLLVS